MGDVIIYDNYDIKYFRIMHDKYEKINKWQELINILHSLYFIIWDGGCTVLEMPTQSLRRL